MSPPVALLVVLLCVWGGVCAENSTKWDCYHFGYGPDNGPLKWAEFCPACGGEWQSPIYINADSVDSSPDTKLNGSLFDTDRWFNSSYSYLVENDGHTVNLRLLGAEDVCISGTDLDGLYCLDHVHFKWTELDKEGSEHLIEIYSAYGMERHLVFYSKKYDNYEEASKKEGGVAIMAQELKLIPSNGDTFMEPIVNALPSVRNPGQVTQPDERLRHNWLVPDFAIRTLFYKGSLTMPPCTEGVLWMIYAPQYGISRRQLAEFRKLLSEDGTPMVSNTRPIQDNYGRRKWSQTALWLHNDALWPFQSLQELGYEEAQYALSFVNSRARAPSRRAKGGPRKLRRRH